MHHQVIIAFAAYFTILLAIGIVSHKKHTSEADFVIGGRGLNFWVTALSAHASDMSSWLFMGFPMAIFVGGLSQSWIAVGLLGGMFLSWQFLAPALRTETERLRCYTLSSYFERRFDDHTGTIRFVSAVMTFIFMLHYLAAGLTGMGFIFESLFDINYYIGITVATIIIAAYTFYGGYVTVAWTDLFQGIFLLAVLLIVPFFAMGRIDGWHSIVDTAAEQGKSLSLTKDGTFSSVLNSLFLAFGWGLGYFGQPHIMTKFMGIKNPKDLKKSKYLGMTWQLLALGAATLIGLIGIPFFNGGLDNSELVFVQMVHELFNPLVGGFILCAVLAATISTMDSQIIVSAGVLTEDIYRLLFRSKHSSAQMLKKSRWSVILTAAIAYGIACDQSKTVMSSVTYSWTGLGCALGPLVLMSLYYRPTNKYGAVAGILTGGIIAGFWATIGPWLGLDWVPAMIPGFSLAGVMIYIVSKVTASRFATLLFT